jgi:hypothetical protein
MAGCDGTIIFHPLPICERICRSGSSLARLPNLISARWRTIYPHIHRTNFNSIGVLVHRLPLKDWKQSLESTLATKQRASVARSFCEPAKRHPKRKRSPATIYGGLRLAGTLVLLHPSWFLSIPLIAVSCDLLHGSTFKHSLLGQSDRCELARNSLAPSTGARGRGGFHTYPFCERLRFLGRDRCLCHS